jgi:hypothetical protein
MERTTINKMALLVQACDISPLAKTDEEKKWLDTAIKLGEQAYLANKAWEDFVHNGLSKEDQEQEVWNPERAKYVRKN